MCVECGLALVSRGELVQQPEGLFEMFVCRNPACGRYGKGTPVGGGAVERRRPMRLGTEQDRATADARAEYVRRRMEGKRR